MEPESAGRHARPEGRHRRSDEAPELGHTGGERGRRGLLAAASAAAALAVLGGGLITAGLRAPGGPPAPAAAAAEIAAPDPAAELLADLPLDGTTEVVGESGARRAAEVRRARARSAVGLRGPSLGWSKPIGLEIPELDVRSDKLVDLGLTPAGTLEVPVDYALPGWYEPGPAPGQFGPAVIAGHVDSKRGPAVFYRLGELEPGDEIRVRREDGRTARFVVDRVARYPKDRFPTVEVYGDSTRRAELRLITCGGAFDERTGHYADNIVAFAHLV